MYKYKKIKVNHIIFYQRSYCKNNLNATSLGSTLTQELKIVFLF